MRYFAFLSCSFVSCVVLGGCVSDEPATFGETNDAGGDGSTIDGDGGADATTDGAACAPSCSSATTLKSCGTADQTCALGCTSAGTPHCAVLQPSGPVTAADLTATSVGDLVFSNATVMHTDTGAIDGIRGANVGDASTYQVIANIGFALFPGSHVGVFTVKTFTVDDNIVVRAIGSAAVAVVATDSMSIQGIFDARGFDGDILCGATEPGAVGPGGTAGGVNAGTSGVGAGGGTGDDVGGGGGGGFGGKGGNGQISTANGTEAAADSVGGAMVAFALPISGGFGGGTNGAGGGGGGGGAVQLVAENEIRIGGGAHAGGINVGGCGGFGGKNGSVPNVGGGGGGSGGEILLQSPLVTMLMNGVIAANGGAGGSGGGFGAAGLLSDQLAPPVPVNGTTMTGPGGAGGAGTTLEGADAGPPITTLGGGGGGAVGRIRIDDATGTIVIPAGALISPSIGTSATTTMKVLAN